MSTPLSKRERVQLMSELAAPYRKLRLFIYLAVGLSGGMGAFIYFLQVLAGRNLEVALPTLALQLGVLAAAIGLIRWENKAQRQLQQRVKERLEL